MERKHIAENIPGWRWCLAPGCRAGQVHEQILKVAFKKAKKKGRGNVKKVEAVKMEESEVMPDICECHECGAKACVTCDRPWHEGESCAEYQLRIKDRVDEEDRALNEIRKITKQCPGCKKPVQKNGGCPAMQCKSLQPWLKGLR